MYLVPNNKVNQLHRHTRAYLNSISQIPSVYQIARAWSSQKRTRPYGENETLTTTIGDLILDTISEIRDPIETIEHQEDTEFPNFLDFLEGDSNFQDFPKAEEGDSRPPEPPKNKTTGATPTYPRPNFRLIATMAANRPWLAADVVAVPRAQHPLLKHPEKTFSKIWSWQWYYSWRSYQTIHAFFKIIGCATWRCGLYIISLYICRKALTWFFNLAAGSIASWQQFETTFINQFGDDRTSGVLVLELSRMRCDKKDG